MSTGVSVFSQILKIVPRSEFDQAVAEYEGDKHQKGFRCWDQFISMMFCQLAQAKSLQEIICGLTSCEGKLNHLGVANAPKKSTLAYANANRPWEIYERMFYSTLAICKQDAPRKPGRFRFKAKLYSIDATVIDLCISIFDWAKFRKTKGAVKVNMMLDHDGCLPCFANITAGNNHEVKFAWGLKLAAETVVAMDRGFIDYGLFQKWTEQRVWFVTRIKENASYEIVEERETNGRGVLDDCIIKWTGYVSSKKCTAHMRLVRYMDPETGKIYEFLTNNMKLAARTIADIYRERWQIESFFKMLKQNFKIKTFVGTSANALKIQIWTALIAILLMKYLQFRSSAGLHLSNLVALVRWNLFTYRDLWKWLNNPFYRLPEKVPQQMTFPFLDSAKY